MALLEACLSCSGANEKGYLWDPQNGVVRHDFNQMTGLARSTVFAPKQRIVYSSNANKAALTIHYATKDVPRYRCPLPEKMTCLSINPACPYLVGGAASGKVYLWNIATGALLRFWDAHYKEVTRALFSQDGSFLVTASEDATVKSWSLCHVLDVTLPAHAELRPHNTYMGHTLGAVDMALSTIDGRAVTVSKDRTMRLHDYILAQELRCCLLPSAPKCVAIDTEGTSLFAGCSDGKIYQAELYPERQRTARQQDDSVPQKKLLEALLGHDTEHAAHARTTGLGEYYTTAFEGHKGGVSAICCSTDSLHLYSGGADGNVHIWRISSKQLIRVFSQHKAPVTALSLALIPVKMPSEKESSLTSPFAALKKVGITGEGADDFTTPAYHGTEFEAAAKDDDDRTTEKKSKRARTDAEPASATPAVSASTTVAPVSGKSAVSYVGGDKSDAINLVARLYNIVAVQQQKIEELSAKVAAG
ncbi:Pre-rRNA-processing protein IPI3 [Diplonema papillatum]|nr:Pre-rRNA-processing protein IPI3 [Diplonema papillatum]